MTNPRPPRPDQPSSPSHLDRAGRSPRPTAPRTSADASRGEAAHAKAVSSGIPPRAAATRVGPARSATSARTGATRTGAARTGSATRAGATRAGQGAARRTGRGTAQGKADNTAPRSTLFNRPPRISDTAGRGVSDASRGTGGGAGRNSQRGAQRKGLAAFFGTDELSTKRTLLIIGAVVVVVVIIVAAVVSQRASSTDTASTVTAITSTTVDGENRTVAPEASSQSAAPDFSQLAMNPSTDPDAQAYFAAIKKGGVPVKDSTETALLGVGYSYCQVKVSNDTSQKKIQDVMMEALTQLTPGVKNATLKKVVYGAADKHLCPSLQEQDKKKKQ